MVHSHKDQMGMRLRPNGRDRHCMAVHVKVNGLDTYALLDSGCTTIHRQMDRARELINLLSNTCDSIVEVSRRNGHFGCP